jgi:hypothetical protein
MWLLRFMPRGFKSSRADLIQADFFRRRFDMSRFAFIPHILCIPFRHAFRSAMMAGLVLLCATATAQAQDDEADSYTRAQAEHARFLAKGPPEKLYSYASRREREGDYEGAMEALLAIVENFPKSDFTAMAMKRTGVLQDKIDMQEAREQEAEWQEQEGQRQRREASEYQQQQEQWFADQKRQQYDACRARYDSCLAQSGSLADVGMDFLKDAAALYGGSYNAMSSNMGRRVNSIDSQQAQCSAIERECRAYE